MSPFNCIPSHRTATDFGGGRVALPNGPRFAKRSRPPAQHPVVVAQPAPGRDSVAARRLQWQASEWSCGGMHGHPELRPKPAGPFLPYFFTIFLFGPLWRFGESYFFLAFTFEILQTDNRTSHQNLHQTNGANELCFCSNNSTQLEAQFVETSHLTSFKRPEDFPADATRGFHRTYVQQNRQATYGRTTLLAM